MKVLRTSGLGFIHAACNGVSLAPNGFLSTETLFNTPKLLASLAVKATS
jgi:hypothetical protein